MKVHRKKPSIQTDVNVSSWPGLLYKDPEARKVPENWEVSDEACVCVYNLSEWEMKPELIGAEEHRRPAHLAQQWWALTAANPQKATREQRADNK